MSARGTHLAGGAALGLAVAQTGIAAGWPVRDAVLLAVVSTVTGPLPDIDQRRTWRTLDRWLPDELLGAGGPLQHRGISHWIGWPPLAAAAWWALLAVRPALHAVWWAGYGLALGVASHLILDALYGRQVRMPTGAIVVRRGIPTLPWWRHRGGIWTSSGPGSQLAGLALTACSGWLAWLITHG